MTPSDLITTLLLIGFVHQEYEETKDENTIIIININNEDAFFNMDLSYKSIWRNGRIQSYDIGAMILADGRVLVLHELEVPNDTTWEHHYIFDSPKEAWDFIRNFLQEHP